MLNRFFNLFGSRRERLEQDLERELRHHLDCRIDELTASGVDEAEARRQAILEFGGRARVEEEVRDAWMWRSLDALAIDVRHSIRGLSRNWTFSLGAGTVLSIAVGATVAIFSVVNAVLLQPLPYPDADRIVSAETLWTTTGRASQDVSGPDFVDWQSASDVFETMTAFYGNEDDATVVSDRAVFANTREVSKDFFAVFGQNVSAGRLFTEEDQPSGEAESTVAVVAHSWAVTHFGSALAALDQTIRVYGHPKRIVGVAAPEFRYPGASDIWAPLSVSGQGDRAARHYRVVAKLKPGTDLSRARARMKSMGDDLARRNPENRDTTVALIPLRDRLASGFRTTLWTLMGAVGVVWLIACANIANLMLARAAARRREVALRAALGAGRGRVARQLLTESCVFAAGAGTCGLLLAFVFMKTFVAMSPATLPRIGEIGVDAAVVLFAFALTLGSTALFGIVPALFASRIDLSDALKQGGSKGAASSGGTRFRSALVVAEVALSVVLLAGASLLARSFLRLENVDLGFTTERVLVAYTEYAVEDDREAIRARSRFYGDVLDRVRAMPGVSAASGVAYLGMGREPRSARDYFIEGRPEPPGGQRSQAELHAVTGDYFKTLEIPVRTGREFGAADTPEQPRVAVINDALARAAFPGASALGQRIRTSARAPWMEIVGVVGGTRWQDPSREAPPVIFVPSTQDWGNSLSILARTTGDEKALSAAVRDLLHEVNPTLPVRFETMREMFDSALAYPRFRARVLGLFAGVSALLAAIGLFSVLSYLVELRTREIAIRRSIGAQATDVLGLIVGEGLRLVAAGLVLGLGGALAIARLLEGFLFEISPWDASAYVIALSILGLASLLATVIPAIRAARVAPLTSLQEG